MGWLAGFFEMLWQAVVVAWPLSYVRANEMGLRYRHGRPPQVLKPGLHWNIIWLDEFETEVCLPKWVDMPDQLLETIDGRALALSGAVYREISDLYLYNMAVEDAEQSLMGMVMNKVAEHVTRTEFDKVTINSIKGAIRRSVRHEARKWGITVLEVGVNKLAETRPLWVDGDGRNVLDLGDD